MNRGFDLNLSHHRSIVAHSRHSSLRLRHVCARDITSDKNDNPSLSAKAKAGDTAMGCGASTGGAYGVGAREELSEEEQLEVTRAAVQRCAKYLQTVPNSCAGGSPRTHSMHMRAHAWSSVAVARRTPVRAGAPAEGGSARGSWRSPRAPRASTAPQTP